MKNEKIALVITSIASQNNEVLQQISKEANKQNIQFIVIGDTKSPKEFELAGCDFYSVERQQKLNFGLISKMPFAHYARKNIGYLQAISKGAEIIIETDDDNYPLNDFWNLREKQVNAYCLSDKGWINVYKFFTDKHIWPRGFALENILDDLPKLESEMLVNCPIQQGLADDNPDVDAIYRLTLPLPIKFNKFANIALGKNSICPFNSQNTTWFREAFPLMYLPSYCSFRLTDIWRSFIAQRVAWTCNWFTLFHNATVRQERNEHNLMIDFRDEISGYSNNLEICRNLFELNLKEGSENIPDNMLKCYEKMVELGHIGKEEMILLDLWLNDFVKLS